MSTSRVRSTHIDEMKYDVPDGNRDKDDHKSQERVMKSAGKPDVTSPREVELREAFEHADFSEKAGTPAERLEKMSKAVNALTAEREELAKQRQIAEDSQFWKEERAKAQAASPKHKARTVAKEEPAVGAAAGAAAEAQNKKVEEREERPAAAPKKASFTREQDLHEDDERGHGQDYPSERVSKLDRPAKDKLQGLVDDMVPDKQQQEEEENIVKDKDEVEGAMDKLEELPWQERNGFARQAGSEADAIIRRDHIRLAGRGPLPGQAPKPSMEVQSFEATKRAREQDRKELIDKSDEANQPEPNPYTLKEEIKYELNRLSMLGTKGGELHAPVHASPHPPLRSELDRAAKKWMRGSIGTTGDMPDWKTKKKEEEGILSSTKQKIDDGIDRVEDKLSEWKSEAGDKYEELKHKFHIEADEAKSKASELKDEAVDKASELKDDVRDKGREWKADVREKTSVLESKASSMADKAKSEIKEDVAILKDKAGDLGQSIKRKTDKVVGKVEDTTEDIKNKMMSSPSASWWDRMVAQTGWWPKEPVSYHTGSSPTSHVRPGISGTVFPVSGPSQYPVSSSKFDVRADPTDEDYIPSAGREKIFSPEQMQSSIDELRALETNGWRKDSSWSGGIRSQLSHKWQDIKEKERSEQHDWDEEADAASSADMDNAPTSPRVLEHSTAPAGRWGNSRWANSQQHINSFSPSLSDVLPDEPLPRARRMQKYTTTHTTISTPVSPTQGLTPVYMERERAVFVGDRDLKDLMDSIVEPW